MGSLEKPSVLHARSGVGSSKELDEYGVWVKSEPENFVETSGLFKLDQVKSPPDSSAEKMILDVKSSAVPREAIESLKEVSSQEAAQTMLLQTIAKELSEIKNEISSLKSEISNIKNASEFEKSPEVSVKEFAPETSPFEEESAPAGSSEPASAAGVQFNDVNINQAEAGVDKQTGESKASSFFGENEDDVVMLTGDELSRLNSDDADDEENAAAPVLEGEDSEGFDDAPPIDEDAEDAETLSLHELDNILINADVVAETSAPLTVHNDENFEAEPEAEDWTKEEAPSNFPEEEESFNLEAAQEDSGGAEEKRDFLSDAPDVAEDDDSFDETMGFKLEDGEFGEKLEPGVLSAEDAAPVEERADDFSNVTIELEEDEQEDDFDPFKDLSSEYGEEKPPLEEEIIISSQEVKDEFPDERAGNTETVEEAAGDSSYDDSAAAAPEENLEAEEATEDYDNFDDLISNLEAPLEENPAEEAAVEEADSQGVLEDGQEPVLQDGGEAASAEDFNAEENNVDGLNLDAETADFPNEEAGDESFNLDEDAIALGAEENAAISSADEGAVEEEGLNAEGFDLAGLGEEAASAEDFNAEENNVDGLNLDAEAAGSANEEGSGDESFNLDEDALEAAENAEGSFEDEGAVEEGLNAEGFDLDALDVESASAEDFNAEENNVDGLNLDAEAADFPNEETGDESFNLDAEAADSSNEGSGDEIFNLDEDALGAAENVETPSEDEGEGAVEESLNAEGFDLDGLDGEAAPEKDFNAEENNVDGLNLDGEAADSPNEEVGDESFNLDAEAADSHNEGSSDESFNLDEDALGAAENAETSSEGEGAVEEETLNAEGFDLDGLDVESPPEDFLKAENDEGKASEEESEDAEAEIPAQFKNELKTVLSYMDSLLESLPDEKISEFAHSEQFKLYKKLFKELGIA
ncbi:MAG: hypothetical protein LBC53_09170 [Spirochaetaceae bacterium]|jgi:hypothetical protein|nr:hypothetical protein [Spirochaetaceae bacterium]